MTPDERGQFYAREGYLVVPGAIEPAALDAVRRLIDGQVDEYAHELIRRGKAKTLFADQPFSGRLAALLEGTGIQLRKWSTFLFCREVYDLVASPGLVDALIAVLGPDVTFHGDYQLTPKLPGSELQAFPWHQDTLYYGRPSEHLHIVTAWVPLVDATEENGCIHLIPGSHRWGLFDGIRGADMNVHPLQDPTQRGTPVAMPMRAGDVLLMSNLTFHASYVNRSPDVRWSMDLGFSATAGTRPESAEVSSSRSFIDNVLRAAGRTPLRVAGRDSRAAQSFEDWERRHLASD